MSGRGTHAPDGLAIHQLLKLKAKGLISVEQFLEMTAELEQARSAEERHGAGDAGTGGVCGTAGGGWRWGTHPATVENMLYVVSTSNCWENMWNI